MFLFATTVVNQDIFVKIVPNFVTILQPVEATATLVRVVAAAEMVAEMVVDTEAEEI
jgi:hypothetical protein